MKFVESVLKSESLETALRGTAALWLGLGTLGVGLGFVVHPKETRDVIIMEQASDQGAASREVSDYNATLEIGDELILGGTVAVIGGLMMEGGAAAIQRRREQQEPQADSVPDAVLYTTRRFVWAK